MQVTIEPSGATFLCEGKVSILEAALKAGLNLNYGCSNGNCGLCSARLLSGQVKQIYQGELKRKQADEFLMCCCQPQTDIKIHALEAGGVEDIPWQEIDTRLKKFEDLDDNTFSLYVQTPRSDRLRFLAGQSVELSYSESEPTIELPIASCPCDDRNIFFHIDKIKNSPLVEYLQSCQLKSAISIRGPKGNFVLDESKQKPLIFIAVGVGFGPIKSIIEHAIALEWSSEIALYRIDQKKQPYLDNLCRSWQDALDGFYYQYLPLPQWKESRLVPVLQQITSWGNYYNSEIFLAADEQYIDFLAQHLDAPNAHMLGL